MELIVIPWLLSYSGLFHDLDWFITWHTVVDYMTNSSFLHNLQRFITLSLPDEDPSPTRPRTLGPGWPAGPCSVYRTGTILSKLHTLTLSTPLKTIILYDIHRPCSIYRTGTILSKLYTLTLSTPLKTIILYMIYTDHAPSIGLGPFCPNLTHWPCLHHWKQ